MSSHKFLLMLIFSMLLGNSVVVLAADFDKGWEAYGTGDYETALAEQGDVSAQFMLGVMYDNGEGVLTDYIRA